MDNYQRFVNSISKSSGLSVSEIEDKVKAKQDKISGLISNEGAAQIVAAELGISFEDEKLKLEDLSPGMRRVNTLGKVITLSPVRTFVRNNQESKVANLVIADETSNIKVVLWDSHHIELIETGKIIEGVVVEISNANLRDNEIHLGSFSEFKISNEVLENVKTERVLKEKNIVDLQNFDNISLRAFIVQTSELRFFNVCPECKKKVLIEGENFSCQEHGKVIPEKRALMNLTLDDGTETIRTTVFHEKLSEFGVNPQEEEAVYNQQKQDLLGKEMIFLGGIRMNKFFNNLEMVVDSFQEVNIDELLVNLEKA
jgi:ssDNA-binding replication factor A large subunit